MNHIEKLIERMPALAGCADAMCAAVDAICRAHLAGGKILLCGNGGSAADCEHISGELLKGFLLPRPAEEGYPDALQRGVCAIPLTSMSAALSAFANDCDPALVFAQLTYAMGRAGDVFVGLSTSGNSRNVVEAAHVAKRAGLVTVALTGESGGALLDICDVTIRVPAKETYLVQEFHLPVYHALCAEVEARLFGA
ncbi:MAG: SIS domain-containing protein [Clostridia bacterium]|nr:SIS domain-containing protein [Clostridia bacterium]